MADDDIRDKEPADDLAAFDSIDATMKDPSRKAVTVTPEALAQIVNDAVAKAITAYKESRDSTPESADTPQQPPVAQVTPRRAKIEQLQDDLGLDEIEFDTPRTEAAEKKVERELSSQMGVHDFEFEDASGAAAEPDAPTRTEADAMAGWATRTDATAEWVTPPVQRSTPPPTPEVDETPTPAAAKEKVDDWVPRFDWVAEELKRLEAEETPTALDLEPLPVIDEPLPAIEEPVPVIDEALALVVELALAIEEPIVVAIEEPIVLAIEEPIVLAIEEPIVPAIEEPPAAPKPPVRASRGGLAGWFRSALGNRSPKPEPAASVTIPEPEAPVISAAAAVPQAPEPPVAPPPPIAAPPPIVARHEEPSRPTRDPAAALKALTPEEEAAKSIFFTFDPIPPVPPRLPREPKDSKEA